MSNSQTRISLHTLFARFYKALTGTTAAALATVPVFATVPAVIVTIMTTASSAHAAPFHVVVDPGHGGIDTGATKGKLRESEIALKVAHKLADLLREDPNFKVSMTRTTNQTLTLPQRTQFAKEAAADLFVSIHLNSSNDPRAHGKEFYFQNQLPADEEAMFLASRENAENPVHDDGNKRESLSPKSDLKRILEDLNRNERILASSELSRNLLETWSPARMGKKRTAIRQAPFYVVSNAPVPSVLVEIGYLSHPQEGPKLADATYQDELARSLYNGLTKFRLTVSQEQKSGE